VKARKQSTGSRKRVVITAGKAFRLLQGETMWDEVTSIEDALGDLKLRDPRRLTI
jgi:hypothetical protein